MSAIDFSLVWDNLPFSTLFFLGASILMASLLGAYFFIRLQYRLALREKKRRLQKGIAAEIEGGELLKKRGFKLLALQQTINAQILIDGRKVAYEIRPDGLATKEGKKFAVEIKSGACAANPLFRETRRQILEYYYSLPVDGVLLVDVDRERILEITFISCRPAQVTQSKSSVFFFFLLLFGFLLGFFAQKMV